MKSHREVNKQPGKLPDAKELQFLCSHPDAFDAAFISKWQYLIDIHRLSFVTSVDPATSRGIQIKLHLAGSDLERQELDDDDSDSIAAEIVALLPAGYDWNWNDDYEPQPDGALTVSMFATERL